METNTTTEKMKITYRNGHVRIVDVTLWDAIEVADHIAFCIEQGYTVEEVK